MGVFDDISNAWSTAQSGASVAPSATTAEEMLVAATQGLDLSMFEPGAAAAVGGSPLAAAAAEMTAMAEWHSGLPTWARDLQIVGPIQPGGENGTPNNLFVWMADKQKTVTTTIDPNEGRGGWGNREPETTTSTEEFSKAQTVTRALNLPYTWDEDEVLDAMDTMREAGLEVETFEQLKYHWANLVDRAAGIYSMSEGEKKVTPWDVLDMQRKEAEASGSLTAAELDPNRTETMVRRSVQDITEGQAWSVLQRTLSGMLGHDPSDQEIRDYTYRMNQLAASNPSISKTITKYKDGRAVSESTNSKTGFTGDDMMQEAYEDAQSNPEYAEYQAGSTYFNAALSALGAIGQG